MLRKFALPLILLAVALPYIPALRYGFVYDDHGAIEENTFLDHGANAWRALTLQTLRDPSVLDGQRPVLLLTHFAERVLWGVNPLGYHHTHPPWHTLSVIIR